MKNAILRSHENSANHRPITHKPRFRPGLQLLSFIALVLILQFVAPGTASSSCSFQSRPIQLGVCGSSPRDYCGGCLSGTLGSTVKDSSGTQYILSNNHILVLYNTGQTGDAIEQPSCGGTQDTVANLTRFIPLSTSGNNNVDAAIAKVVSGKVNTSDSILGIGSVSQTTGCIINGFVEKQGAGSGLPGGQILSCLLNEYVKDPCSGITYTFVNQIEAAMTTPLTAGDSGSLLVTQGTPKAMGLIFGASAASGNLAFVNPIGAVLSAFNVTMAAPTTIAPSVATTQTPEGAPSVEQIEAEGVVSKYSPDLMKIPGVWGVGASAYPDGHMYISVHVEAITPEIKSRVPTTLGGFPVEFTVGPVPHFL